jgi:hypothetical protein
MLEANDQDKPERMAYSISDAAWVLGDVSQNHVRNLISEGALDKIQIGRRVMVSTLSIKRLLAAGGTANGEKEAA